MNPNNSNTNGMDVAAMVLGIVSIPTICCSGLGIPVAAVGIIFALLSRRGRRMSPQAKVGFGLSLGSIIVTFLMLISIFAFAFSTEEFQNSMDILFNMELNPEDFSSQQDLQEYMQEYLEEQLGESLY